MIETLLLVLLFGLLIGGIIIFNRLVKARNRVKAAWSDIDVQLQRRHDLIPRLVEAVKAYAGYEKATLTAVTELRAQSERAPHLAEKARIEQEIETGLHRLIAVAEAYPDLKANQNFLELQKELTDVEDHLQYARRYYNGSVRTYNTRIESFPDLLVARPLRFRQREFFDAGDEVQHVPKVSLS